MAYRHSLFLNYISLVLPVGDRWTWKKMMKGWIQIIFFSFVIASSVPGRWLKKQESLWFSYLLMMLFLPSSWINNLESPWHLLFAPLSTYVRVVFLFSYNILHMCVCVSSFTPTLKNRNDNNAIILPITTIEYLINAMYFVK